MAMLVYRSVILDLYVQLRKTKKLKKKQGKELRMAFSIKVGFCNHSCFFEG